MIEQFEIISGSVRGREHERLGQNSHDSVHFLSDERRLVALVCDGCGSGAHSEVGAKLGGALVARSIFDSLADPACAFADALETARIRALAELRTVATAVGAQIESVVCDYLLFTVVGAVLTPQRCCVFAHGDGITVVNGMVHLLDYQNMPPYLAYGLVEGALAEEMRAQLGFRVVADLATSELDSLVVATDGFGKVCAPSDSATPHPLERIWEQEHLFKNSARLGRELTLLSRDRTRIDWQRRLVRTVPGVLDDDTTVVALRRRGDRSRYLS